jgi:hypothetical protein
MHVRELSLFSLGNEFLLYQKNPLTEILPVKIE